MFSKRYTIVLADRSSGVIRRFTIGLRPALLAVCSVVGLPMLMGLGARWSATAEIEQLRAANQDLEVENASYRTATAELTSQITSLQNVIADIGERSVLEPTVAEALNRLPELVKARAMGGEESTPPVANWLTSPLSSSPEDTFGVLRDLLGTLEGRLQFVKTGVERRRALADATPSIWPAKGWLSGTYGNRRDPFTGRRAFHPALDISSDYGSPVYATAAGSVKSAAYSGAYGNLVELTHNFGLATRYGHLSRFAVKPGERVERGQVVGYVGSTGRATGAHVHYEVWVNGRPINPLKLLAARK